MFKKKKVETKEYELVNGKLQETVPTDKEVVNEDVNNEVLEQPLEQQPIEQVQLVEQQDVKQQNVVEEKVEQVAQKKVIVNNNPEVIKIKDFNLHYNLTRNPFLHKNSDHDNINSIEEYYILKGRKYYNFGALIRTKLINPFSTKRLVKKAFKVWREEADNEINDLVVLGDAQAMTDSSEAFEIKLKFINNLLPYLGFIILFITFGSNFKIFNKFEGSLEILPVVGVALCIFSISMNYLFNKAIKTYNKVVQKGINEYQNLKVDFINKCHHKFDETTKYYCKKINRKFNKDALSIDDTSYSEADLIELQTTITNNSKIKVSSEKTKKKNKLKRGLLKFISVITLLSSLGMCVYSIVLHFITK